MEDKKTLELVAIVKETGVINPQAELIISKFKPLFIEAQDLIAEAETIKVTSITQVEDMKKAKEIRAALRAVRKISESTKKELKEDALKYGNAIQGVYNLIEKATKSAEEKLEASEKFAERLEEEKAKTIKAERINLLSQYVEDVSIYSLDGMNEEVFSNLLSGAKTIWDSKQAEIKKIEDERLAKIEEDNKENERVRIENAKLLKEKEARDVQEEKEKKARETEQKKVDDAHKKELEKERELQKELADELKKKNDAESKRIQERDKEIAENSEKERQSKLAPEKDKLAEYAEMIRTIKSPEGLSKAGLEVVKTTEERLLAVAQYIKLAIKEL